MTTQVFKTNGDLLTTIDDYKTNTTSSSLQLSGRGSSNFATVFLNNEIFILENFCNTTSPQYPLEGQIWYQNFKTNDDGSTTEFKKLKYYINDTTLGDSGWIQVADQFDVQTINNTIGNLNSNLSDEIAALQKTLSDDFTNLQNQLTEEIQRAEASENTKVNRAGDKSITGTLRATLLNVTTDGSINISPAYQTTTTNTLVELYAQDHSSIGNGEQAVVHIDSVNYGNKYWYFDISTGDIITPNGTVATTGFAQDLLPKGSIILWYGSSATIPQNWAICDGNNGTPNMTGKTAVGSDSDTNIGNNIGSEYASASTDSHVLTIDEMPAHSHSYGYRHWSDSGRDTGHNIVADIYSSLWPTTTVGGNQGHTHGLTTVSTVQPSVKLYYIMKIS